MCGALIFEILAIYLLIMPFTLCSECGFTLLQPMQLHRFHYYA